MLRMRKLTLIVALIGLAHTTLGQIPTFKPQEIDASLKIGYGVILVDINDDEKVDIVVCDKERVIWFENPTWKLRVISDGNTTPDNVCIDAHDIDGDGKLDLALGAGWKPGNTKEPSTLQWLRRRKALDEPWEMFHIVYKEPTLHRIRFVDLDGSGETVLVTVPLMGRGSTKENNWNDAGVRIDLLSIPPDPTNPVWPAENISKGLHVAHNFDVRPRTGRIWVASSEGVTALLTRDNVWSERRVFPLDPTNPAGNRGASEVDLGKTSAATLTATIEPWHGHQVVVYSVARGAAPVRTVIDDQLRWGHAISCVDLDADGTDEIVAGVRDPLPGKAQHGVRLYRAADATGTKWDKFELDPGGVAVEDLAVADLDADGKPDIVAVGRQTKNVRVYWNQGK